MESEDNFAEGREMANAGACIGMYVCVDQESSAFFALHALFLQKHEHNDN